MKIILIKVFMLVFLSVKTTCENSSKVNKDRNTTFQDSNPSWFQSSEAYDLSSCPPGYERVSQSNNKYCFQIGSPDVWNYPCLTSGGASVITDLSAEEFKSIITSLNQSSLYKQFWLPARRRKMFNPVIWTIPGPNWGQIVDKQELNLLSSLLRNCLLLDVDKETVATEVCSKELPSLCIYVNEIDSLARCPEGFYGFKFLSDNGTCFGIERSNDSNGLNFDDFLNDKCDSPMGDSVYSDLTTFLYLKIAEIDHQPENEWCWYKTISENSFNRGESLQKQYNGSIVNNVSLQAIINGNGTLEFIDKFSNLSCMACIFKIKYNESTELQLEYIPEELKLFLTIYFPSGLWKYDNDDIGVQCFSDAKGFEKPINIHNIPFIQMNVEHSTAVEKAVYLVDLITNRSAQYWCEAHNKTFSLLSSRKIVANPTTNSLHVFALVIKIHVYDDETFPDLAELSNDLTKIFSAQKVLVMDIYGYIDDCIMILLHLHVDNMENFEDEKLNLLATYNDVKSKAISVLPNYNIDFVNISSCLYCLPSLTYEDMVLEWDITKIGEVTAPKQFCLQSNGLPVRRHCLGSYLNGGIWGDVEGKCNETYEPSAKTTFLYNFAKGQISDNFTVRFLIDGLEFVLDDVGSIIPADIYYLSMSLQHVISIVQENETSIEMGDIENMAWAIDRILLMDPEYLRLSQTFNSTNVILDSVNEIIEKLAHVNSTTNVTNWKENYQLSIKPKFIVQVSYPAENNITGLALIRQDKSNNFTEMIVQPLFANSSVSSVLEIENLEIATWVPEIVLKTLQRNSNNNCSVNLCNNDIHVVVSVYSNDGIFQQLDPSPRVINSRIIGLTIPGFKTNLMHAIPLLFKEIQSHNYSKLCGYWDFQTRIKGNNPGYWSKTGCYYQKSHKNVTVCQCYHMTHFGQLIDLGELKNPGGNPRPKYHAKALNIITLVGSFLSLFGIVCIWITASVFQAWRKKPGTKVLLQLSTAIAMPLIFIIIFNLDDSFFYEEDGQYIIWDHKKVECIILGALLQYSILASFTWMLITAVLQFIRYVKVLGVCRPARFLCKLTVVGWGIPFIPVAIVLIVDVENYIPEPATGSEKRICYPTGYFLVFGILFPVIMVVIINVALFISVLSSISRGPEGKMRTSDIDLIKTQLRLSLFLFFLLGLTWIFGIFSFCNNLLWSYLFCLTSTLQGFVLFIYFIICDPATRNLWLTLIKPQFKTVTPRKSITSISSS